MFCVDGQRWPARARDHFEVCTASLGVKLQRASQITEPKRFSAKNQCRGASERRRPPWWAQNRMRETICRRLQNGPNCAPFNSTASNQNTPCSRSEMIERSFVRLLARFYPFVRADLSCLGGQNRKSACVNCIAYMCIRESERGPEAYRCTSRNHDCLIELGSSAISFEQGSSAVPSQLCTSSATL